MLYAGVAELADAPDLGSGGTPVQVQVLSPAPKNPFTDLVKGFFYFLFFGVFPRRRRGNTHI